MDIDGFGRIINALSGLSIGRRRALRNQVERMSEAETARLMIETLGLGAKICPNCGSERRWRHGTASGLQRYRCQGCGRTYNALTGSPLARLKRRGLWLKFAFTLIAQMTVREAARYCGVAKDTALHWRHRMTAALAPAQAETLAGIIEVEAIYFRHNQKGVRRSDRLSREPTRPRRRTPVLIVRDRSQATLAQRLPAATAHEIDGVMSPRVDADSVICIGKSHALRVFAAVNGLTVKTIEKSAQNGSSEPAFHRTNAAAFSSELRLWMRKFRGVATHHLQKYLNWRVFVARNSGLAAEQALLMRALTPVPTPKPDSSRNAPPAAQPASSRVAPPE